MKVATIRMFALVFGLLGAAFLAFAQDSDPIQARPVRDYASHQVQNNVAVAAEPFEGGDKVNVAFGSADPYAHGFLPVLLVIANESDSVLQLDKLRVQFVDSERRSYDPVSAEDLMRFGARGRWGSTPPPVSWPWPRGNARSPLDVWQIRTGEFKASFIAPQASASGFFYFWTGSRRDPIPGATVYVTGLVDGRSAKDLMYFEVSLEPYNAERHAAPANPVSGEAAPLKMIRYR